MRLSFILLAVLAIQLEIVSAVAGGQPNTRRLRAAVKREDCYNDKIEDDGLHADNEERMVSAASLKKVVENKKILNKMLENKVLRCKVFARWDAAGHAYNDVKNVVTDPKLLNHYFNYLHLGPQRRAKPRRVHPT